MRKISRQKLRLIIKEVYDNYVISASGDLDFSLTESKMTATRGAYGSYSIEDSNGREYIVGEIVKSLIDAGKKDLFNDYAPPNAFEHLVNSQERGQGIMTWETDVFTDFYNVDLEKAIRLYAEMNGMEVEFSQKSSYSYY